MLGLPEFRVLAVAEVDGELQVQVQVQVETTADLVGCPSCAAVAVLHDRRLRLVRDLPAGGHPVLLCWSKRVWRCRHKQCPAVTFSEKPEAIRLRGVLTERARAEACRRVGQDAVSVAQVATDLGVGWPTVMRAVAKFGHRILDAAWVDRAVVGLGVDKTAFRIPQLHQLPAQAVAALRHHLEHSTHHTNQGTLTTHGAVEPKNARQDAARTA